MKEMNARGLMNQVLQVGQLVAIAHGSRDCRTRIHVCAAIGGVLAEIADRLPEEQNEVAEEMKSINNLLQSDVNCLLAATASSPEAQRLRQETEIQLRELMRLGKLAVNRLDSSMAKLYDAICFE